MASPDELRRDHEFRAGPATAESSASSKVKKGPLRYSGRGADPAGPPPPASRDPLQRADEAVHQLLPKAEVIAVSGTAVVPTEPIDLRTAVAAARRADVVILAIGGRSAWSDERTEGEGSDTANKDLPPQQMELIDAVTAVGNPTIAVISMGGPYALASVIDVLPAVVTAYYAGPHHGLAIADAIFGVTNPGGKLPFTIPRHVGQVPIHHAQKWGSGYRRTEGDIHHGYLDMPSTPLFVFGHGLSYTTFEYGPLKVERDTVDVSGESRISVSVTNTGERRGAEVVQLYANDPATGVTLPAQQLVGFARVELEPGASMIVTFVLPLSVLAYTGLSGALVMEPGELELCRQQLERPAVRGDAHRDG